MKHLFALLLAAAAATTSAASFDCTKARSTREKQICASPALSTLDERLAAAYRGALDRTADKNVVRKWQRDWLRALDADACASVECLQRGLNARIAELDDVAAADPGGEMPWTGYFSRYFDNRPDRHTAHVMLIALRGGRVRIVGDALWLGPNAKNGQVNNGELDGVGRLDDGVLRFDGDGCVARMEREGPLLLVRASGGCGGANVTFDGDYRRVAP